MGRISDVESTGGKEAAWTADKGFWENIMWNSGHDAYLESRVLTADPIELVNLLYQACTQAVREARYHLAAGRIAINLELKQHGLEARLLARATS